MGTYLIFGLLGWALIQGGCLFKAERNTIFTTFSRTCTFSVCLFSTNKTIKKEHCSNLIPSIYDILGKGGELFKAGHMSVCLSINSSAIRMGTYWRWAQRCQPPEFKVWEIFLGLELLLCRPLRCSDLASYLLWCLLLY